MSIPQQAYRYAHPSVLTVEGGPRLELATANATGTEHPHFFEGQVLQPRLVSELLTAVALVVGTRFFTPANTVAKLIALADPVVTSGGGYLRFEGFSPCCSTYARVDLLPAAYSGDVVAKGTTNVDFNAPMRAALARVNDSKGLHLAVGRDALTLRSGGDEVTERKVSLPLRWLRGMLEVQAYLSAMRRRFEVDSVSAQRFLRTLPKASTSRSPLWIATGPSGLFSTSLRTDNAVRVSEVRRLGVVQNLLPQARSLHAYSDDEGQSSAWVLDFGSARLTLAFSAETWRGFSGEGQGLRALMRQDAAASQVLARVRAGLNWQSALDEASVAGQIGIAPDAVRDALRVLGTSGLVGFDVFESSYFHRVLPLDLSVVEELNPRLSDARVRSRRKRRSPLRWRAAMWSTKCGKWKGNCAVPVPGSRSTWDSAVLASMCWRPKGFVPARPRRPCPHEHKLQA
jgi:hypothetical protein